jgi:hypothetical protein
MTSASNRGTGSTRQGQLAVAYDDVGQVTAMIVQRDGPASYNRVMLDAVRLQNGTKWESTRAQRWDLSEAERTTFGTPASVNGTTITHPSRNPSEVDALPIRRWVTRRKNGSAW